MPSVEDFIKIAPLILMIGLPIAAWISWMVAGWIATKVVRGIMEL